MWARRWKRSVRMARICWRRWAGGEVLEDFEVGIEDFGVDVVALVRESGGDAGDEVGTDVVGGFEETFEVVVVDAQGGVVAVESTGVGEGVVGLDGDYVVKGDGGDGWGCLGEESWRDEEEEGDEAQGWCPCG